MKMAGRNPGHFFWWHYFHESSRRTPGPILRDFSFTQCGERFLLQRALVIMGPGSRFALPGRRRERGRLHPQLLLAWAERAQPQGVELDEARGIAMIVGDRAFLEGDEVLIVQ